MWDRLAIWLAWKLPRQVVRWAVVRVAAHATTGIYSETIASDLTVLQALERWA